MDDLNSPTITLAQQLIACESITPADKGCQLIISERLQKLGFSLHPLPFEDVQNLWAIHGHQAPLFVFAGHTDVVPPGNLQDWDSPPFTPTLKGKYLYGRGAADMKGSLAAMITATERFLQRYPHHAGSLAFLITSDEEGAADHGTQHVIKYLNNQKIQIDYCVVGEPSSHHIVGDVLKHGRRGSLNCNLKIVGKQGHVAYPAKANNPIHQALLPLAKLATTEWDQGNVHFPATSLQISNIHSGTGAVNVIPGTLHCQFNLRFSNEVTPHSLIARINDILMSCDVNYSLEYKVSGVPFLTQSGLLVESCLRAIQEIQNITPTLSTTGGTSDGRFIAPTGAEVIELGPCNSTIHCVNESVNIQDLNLLSAIYERILELILVKQG